MSVFSCSHVTVCNVFVVSVKVLEKKHIMREKKNEYVMREKEVLTKLNHPFFIQLYCTFQDVDRLCIFCFTDSSGLLSI